MVKALIGLGSNSGDRQAILEAAVSKLREVPKTKLIKVSSWHSTKPAGGPVQDDFLNGVASVQTSLDADGLLMELQRIENKLGRVRDVRWGPRTIDLDLLLYGEFGIATTNFLKVPHPRMTFRRFVLEPACEIAADWIHPENGATLRQLLVRLNSTPRRLALLGMNEQFAPIAAKVRAQYPRWELVSEWREHGSLRLVIVCDSGLSGTESSECTRRGQESDSPPVFFCPNHTTESVLQEVLAAIAAME